VEAPLGTYVNLVDSRGELPPFSVRLPRDMTVQRSFASARASRPSLIIDVKSLIEAAPLSCAQLSACIQRSMIIDGRPANSIRFRTGGAYPAHLTVAIPFRDKAIVAEARCVTQRECNLAERILQGAVFGQIATSVG
jgi:hypothetical protein